MDTQSTSNYRVEKSADDRPACKTPMCSTGLMKAGCPSCFLIGLVILPGELAVRAVRSKLSNRNGGHSQQSY